MGAAYDTMCENERLQKTINLKNKQLRKQKKLIAELAEGIVKYFDGDNNYSIQESNAFWLKAKDIFDKQTKNKKK